MFCSILVWYFGSLELRDFFALLVIVLFSFMKILVSIRLRMEALTLSLVCLVANLLSLCYSLFNCLIIIIFVGSGEAMSVCLVRVEVPEGGDGWLGDSSDPGVQVTLPMVLGRGSLLKVSCLFG